MREWVSEPLQLLKGKLAEGHPQHASDDAELTGRHGGKQTLGAKKQTNHTTTFRNAAIYQLRQSSEMPLLSFTYVHRVSAQNIASFR